MGEVVCDDDLISTTIVGKRGAPKMTLIGKLKNNSTKKAILTQKKMFLKEKIYVKENLTPYKYRLFKTTKDFAHKNGFKFVWTRDGNIYIRKNENSRPFLIRNKGMLTKLEICSSDDFSSQWLHVVLYGL